MSKPTYGPGDYVGLHKVNVNSNCRIDISEQHNCVDVYLYGVLRVEHKVGHIVIVSVDAAGRKHYVYVHNLPTTEAK